MHPCSSLSLALISAAMLAWPAQAGEHVHHSESGGANAEFGPFTIKVEIQGVTQGVFASVEGLASQSEVLPGESAYTGPEASAGSETRSSPVEAPGALKGSRLILKRPYDPLLSGLWRWRQSVVDGDPQKRDGDIFIFNGMGQLVAHWMFHEGWPCRWEVPSLKAGSREPAEEIVEIVHAGLTLESRAGS